STEQKKRLYTTQVIPSLGSDDKKEAQQLRLSETVSAAQKRRDEAIKEKEQGIRASSWAEEREVEEETKEKAILDSAIKTVASLDKYLIDIKSRRGQYHKG